MTTYLNCAVGTLQAYVPSAASPWNDQRVKHLYRRIGFGANAAMIESALAKSPAAIVDELVDGALSQAPMTKPVWGDWAVSDYENIEDQAVIQYYELIDYWSKEFLSENPLRSKLVLFWSNHFVTRSEDYQCPSYNYDYFRILEENALGDFKSFVYDIGISPAMLIYLNGIQNTRFEPNENYARELLELFTLGRDNNYTQDDIVNVARALTGWNGFTEACAPINFVPSFHDNSSKTIFGQVGDWGYDELIDLIFTQRRSETATYICTKLYTYYVNREANEDIISELAQIFMDSDFQLEPVLRTLFKSEHFFDEAHFGGRIKSPIESIFGLMKEVEYPIETQQIDGDNFNQGLINIFFVNGEMGQALFNPVDVAGWPGDRSWINSTTLSSRWSLADFIIFDLFNQHKDRLINMVKSYVNNSNDPAFITKQIIDFLIPTTLQKAVDYENGLMAFKYEVPENYFQDGSWNLDWEQEIVAAQIALLLRYISRLPEFQMA